MLITGGKKKKCDNLEGIVKKLSKKKGKIKLRDNLEDTMIKTEKRTNVQKLKMKKNRFFIMSIGAVWLILYSYNTSIQNN